MFLLKDIRLIKSFDELKAIPKGKQLINCINAYSYNVAKQDDEFASIIFSNEYHLIPDGAGIVYAYRLLKIMNRPLRRIAGWDLFAYEMESLKASCETEETTSSRKVVMFVGSTEATLEKIKQRAAKEYPMFDVKTYSPSFSPKYSSKEKKDIIDAINKERPSLLWFGLTAPKQEKLVNSIYNELDIHCHVGTIGAVFDFYSGNVKRAPMWFQNHSLEWFYRLCQEPRRLWRRYIVGNVLFIYYILKEKFSE